MEARAGEVGYGLRSTHLQDQGGKRGRNQGEQPLAWATGESLVFEIGAHAQAVA